MHIACRNPERGEKAKKEIIEKANVNESKVDLSLLDVSQSRDVHAFAKEFSEKLSENGEKLYCLVNNAGGIVNSRQQNQLGYEVSISKKILSYYCKFLRSTLPQIHWECLF